MRIRMLKTCRIRGVPHELGKEYDVEDSLARWTFTRSPPLAEEVKPAPPVEVVEEAPEPAPSKPVAPKRIALDVLAELTDYDEIIMFGEPGTAKSMLAWKIAAEAREAGRKVLYLDCERNLPKSCIEGLGDSYRHFAPTMDAMLDEIEEDRDGKKACKIPAGFDLIVLDSIGYPGLAEFWGLPEGKERFQSFGHAQRISNHLKNYCYENRACAITLDQPVSEIADALGKERGPWGGKIGHTAKTIWRLNLAQQKPEVTRGKIVVWKARDRGRGSLIAEYEISPAGVTIEWKI